MKVAITGGTGLVGHAAVRALRDRGDTATVISRTARQGRLRWTTEHGLERPDALSGYDAVVHLAGAGVADRRWTAAYKRQIAQSRQQGTRSIVAALRCADPRPRVLVSASGIGIYGAGGDTVLTEDSPPGDDFLAEVCKVWETEADAAQSLDVRVAKLRFGAVLDRKRGALAKMLPAFKLGVGGRIASGRQYFAWIHIADAVGALLHVLDGESLSGAFNVTTPHPIDNRTFTAALARAVSRPAFVPVPKFVLRVVFGELADVLVTGQRALPQRLTDSGFEFAHPQVKEALEDLLKP